MIGVSVASQIDSIRAARRKNLEVYARAARLVSLSSTGFVARDPDGPDVTLEVLSLLASCRPDVAPEILREIVANDMEVDRLTLQLAGMLEPARPALPDGPDATPVPAAEPAADGYALRRAGRFFLSHWDVSDDPWTTDQDAADVAPYEWVEGMSRRYAMVYPADVLEIIPVSVVSRKVTLLPAGEGGGP